MKKTFVEPSIKKFELNLSENIAESIPNIQMGFIFWFYWENCTVQYTNRLITQGNDPGDLRLCYADGTESTNLKGRTIVPEEQVRMFIKY